MWKHADTYGVQASNSRENARPEDVTFMVTEIHISDSRFQDVDVYDSSHQKIITPEAQLGYEKRTFHDHTQELLFLQRERRKVANDVWVAHLREDAHLVLDRGHVSAAQHRERYLLAHNLVPPTSRLKKPGSAMHTCMRVAQ